MLFRSFVPCLAGDVLNGLHLLDIYILPCERRANHVFCDLQQTRAGQSLYRGPFVYCSWLLRECFKAVIVIGIIILRLSRSNIRLKSADPMRTLSLEKS